MFKLSKLIKISDFSTFNHVCSFYRFWDSIVRSIEFIVLGCILKYTYFMWHILVVLPFKVSIVATRQVPNLLRTPEFKENDNKWEKKAFHSNNSFACGVSRSFFPSRLKTKSVYLLFFHNVFTSYISLLIFNNQLILHIFHVESNKWFWSFYIPGKYTVGYINCIGLKIVFLLKWTEL